MRAKEEKLPRLQDVNCNVFNNSRHTNYCYVFVLRLKLPNGNPTNITVLGLQFYSDFLDYLVLLELGISCQILRLSTVFS